MIPFWKNTLENTKIKVLTYTNYLSIIIVLFADDDTPCIRSFLKAKQENHWPTLLKKFKEINIYFDNSWGAV